MDFLCLLLREAVAEFCRPETRGRRAGQEVGVVGRSTLAKAASAITLWWWLLQRAPANAASSLELPQHCDRRRHRVQGLESGARKALRRPYKGCSEGLAVNLQ